MGLQLGPGASRLRGVAWGVTFQAVVARRDAAASFPDEEERGDPDQTRVETETSAQRVEELQLEVMSNRRAPTTLALFLAVSIQSTRASPGRERPYGDGFDARWKF